MQRGKFADPENSKSENALVSLALRLPSKCILTHQDLQNHLFQLTLGGKLYRAPIGKDIHNCLDVGTGTGIWAIDFGISSQTCCFYMISLTTLSRGTS